jgi:hypothetical protein
LLLRKYELVDLGFLDERIKHVEDTVRAPNLRLGKMVISERETFKPLAWLPSANMTNSSSVLVFTLARQT